VTRIADLLNVIIPHFTLYPLLSYKWVNYTLWVRAIHIIASGVHTTSAGLLTLLPIYAAMNRGPSLSVIQHFPFVVPVTLPVYTRMFTDLNPWWVTGYLTFWAQFSCGLSNGYLKGVPYHSTWHYFTLSAGTFNHIIMQGIAEFFNGNLYLRTDGSRYDLNITVTDLLVGVCTHFTDYPLPSILSKEFSVWKEFIDIAADRDVSGARYSSKAVTQLWYRIPQLERLIDKLNQLRSNRS